MNVYSLIMPLGSLFIALGAIALFGWAADISFIKNAAPNGLEVNVPTAASILMAGIVVRAFYRIVEGNKQGDSMVRIMSISVLLFLLLVPLAAGYFWGVDLGLEDFISPVEASGVLRQGTLPSVGSIFAIAILFVLTFLVSLGFSISKFSRWSGLFLLLIGGFALLGYVLGEPSFYYLSGNSSGMAMRAAASYSLLGITFLLIGLRPHPDKQPAFGGEANAPAK